MKGLDGKVAGHANVLIFPDLNSANIGYKLVQVLAGANSFGFDFEDRASSAGNIIHGGVRLQKHAYFQAVQKYPRQHRHFFFVGRLLLDD